MPHLLILYSSNLEPELDMRALCRELADTMLAVRDEKGQAVFPVGGTRVLAYASTHHAVADARDDHAFCYFQLRMARGRSPTTIKASGDALIATARARFAPVMAHRPVGLTLQIDEGHEVFDGKFGNLHDHIAARGKPASSSTTS